MGGRPALIMRWYGNGDARVYLQKTSLVADQRLELVCISTPFHFFWFLLDTDSKCYARLTLSPYDDASNYPWRPQSGEQFFPVFTSTNHDYFSKSNILIADDGQAIICDFGSAKLMWEIRPSCDFVDTATSMRWQPPEVLLTKNVRVALSSDIWSVACTAYEVGLPNCLHFLMHKQSFPFETDLDRGRAVQPPQARGDSHSGNFRRSQTI
jgi:serine/threonine protein kinase